MSDMFIGQQPFVSKDGFNQSDVFSSWNMIN